MSEFHDLRIRAINPETENAICVEFEVPEKLRPAFSFRQGQYLTLKAEIDGKELRRCYSICSGVDDGNLRVAIKKIGGGAFSNHAHATLKKGDTVAVMPPQGRFFTELDETAARRYLCIAAGSGITPVLSIVKSVLAREPRSTVTLLYGNQRASTIMFREELGFIKNRYLGRFNWINILSREEQDASVLHGRINNRKGGELNRKRLITIREFDEFFLCGPESMISEVSRGLRSEGILESHIHYELFFANAEDAAQVIEKHQQRATRFGGKVSAVSVSIDGRSSSFELSADGENILDAAMQAGLDVPFSCKGGVCATCKAKLLSGEVDMDLNHALSAEEVAGGYILTCQAHPISPQVVVDFDQS
ncbi:MAG: phenylacetate-CoA oxygenase/reductase subunit PaaK [Gammaproteobacteria bacterium]|jgi:ring-1,2-phenylacetyl-CoA epoxidase subunit PaaE|nr:phenylacetate-CoA oxygenase/reductase subunit PaaK [Gammaproteobacteria bacterium]MBP6050738.1 phenylacetate-CoA oxygenase/reductase subunit PaaK [Pseudomonadales bacterium]MBK6584472.1 phenylacetate-CoA oxygenase/reductase subunit PaaK [Gammaproteobacteria bacterium]MBK7168291.1 phenylacetate-CoA oxygenase/reductase subunit PaaK [Gammaproteobacteria bacterium]MBK7520930.1 phenylacetate-CoA oxygenase/reductase subunit PaaK [Gammaproteobacteria bacterium]